MPRPKKHTSPGIIFLRGNKLYIKIFGKQYSTGLNDTKEGHEFAERMKDKIFKDYLLNNNQLPTVEQPRPIYGIFADYIILLESKNKAKNTIRSYILALKTIVPENIPLIDRDIKQAVNNFLSNRTDLSNTSKNIFLRSFQIFLNHCSKNGFISKINIYNDNKVEVQPKNVEPYSNSDFEAIINAIEHPNSKNIKPDHELGLLLKYQRYSGSRITEALKLTWAQVDFQKSLITLPNKTITTNDDPIPINRHLKPVLVELKDIASKRMGSGKKLKVFKWEPSSSSRLTKRLTIIEKSLGIKIPKQCYHRIRNMFSNKILTSPNLNLIEMRDAMRHKKIQTTIDYYKKFNPDKLREKLDEIDL